RNGINYYWQVLASDGQATTASPIWSFTTAARTILSTAFTPYSGTYQGLIEAPDGALPGFVTLSVTSSGMLTGRLALGQIAYLLLGTFDSSGHWAKVIPRLGLTPLVIDLNLDIINGTNQITGSVSDGAATATVTADRA